MVGLTFHQSQEAIKEALILDDNVIDCDVMQVNSFVSLMVCGIILYSTRGVRYDSVTGVQGLKTTKLNVRYEVN